MSLDDYINNKIDMYSISNSTNKKRDYGNDISDIISALGRMRLPPRIEEHEYDAVLELADDDEFQPVIDRVNTLGQRAAAWGHSQTLRDKLRQAHARYTTNQKCLADAFALAGDFAATETHINNATLSLRGDITLSSPITPEDIQKTIETSLQHTPPTYFLNEVQQAAEKGDIQKTRKYASLTTQSLEKHKLLVVPGKNADGEEKPISGEQYRQYFAFKRMMGSYIDKAYLNAAKKLVREALGYAVRDYWDTYGGRLQINQHRDALKELLLERENMRSKQSTAFITFFDRIIDPIFTELLACLDDKNHPFRTMFKPVTEVFYGPVTDVKPTPAPSTALVRHKDLKKHFGRKKIPAHRFYYPVIECYATAK